MIYVLLFLLLGLFFGGLIGFLYGLYKGKSSKIEDNDRLLDNIRKQQQQDIENTLNKVLVKTSDTLVSSYNQQMSSVLNPFKEEINKFQNRVNSIHDKNTEQNVRLTQTITNIMEANKKLTEETNSLTQALRNRVKIQGSWGEQILKQILEESGLIKGINYLEEETYSEVVSDEEGGSKTVNKRPDFIVKMPNNRNIIIDAKITLNSYVDYFNSTEELKKQAFLKAIKQSIEEHISILSSKNYYKMPGLQTIQGVFMFIPIESLYILLVENFQDLFLKAAKLNIYITSPSGLIPLLNIIEHTWQVSKQEESTKEIIKISGSLYDNLTLLAKSVDDVEKAFTSTSTKFSELKKKLRTNNGGAIQLAHKLKDKGVIPTKQMPEGWGKVEDIEGDREDCLLNDNNSKPLNNLITKNNIN